MRTVINSRLISWASDIDPETIRQAEKASRLPVVYDHVALMPDAHVGIGATVGSVIPTESAIIPSAVGVDVGCGMAAVMTNKSAQDLPNDMRPLLLEIERAAPAGVGKGHEQRSRAAEQWLHDNPSPTRLSPKQASTAVAQLGSLGSGNHFICVCTDEQDRVWVVLHSGSRGIGNQLAQSHISKARNMVKRMELAVEDPDLAYFLQGSPEFDAYIADMLWAQEYALANRRIMMDAVVKAVLKALPAGARALDYISCHHNYAALEQHQGRDLWVTRKGAIRAQLGDMGIIPGSMGNDVYIVRGRGEESSWNSCSHGAGRRMSRAKARETFSSNDLAHLMEGKTWLSDKRHNLVDEIPHSYKDIRQVMADQQDLVEVVHHLTEQLNYKGC